MKYKEAKYFRNSKEGCKRVNRYNEGSNSWNSLPDLDFARCGGHTVIPVPLDWLCGKNIISKSCNPIQ